jgi:ATP-dependent Clp endopeptidase proteolytic subunit ClpP
MAKSWFSMRAAAGNSAAISIYSDIGEWGLTASDFQKSLNELGKPRELQITISSNGGDIPSGFAIYNTLDRHPAKKIVTVDGIAASMASVIAMAGDEIIMPSNSMLMIHNPWGTVGGDSETLISFGEALAKMRDQIAETYAARSGQPLDDVLAMMSRETWLTAQEAVDMGFADRVEESRKMAALVNTSKFLNTPLALRKLTADFKPRSFEDIAAKAWQRYNGRAP